MTGRPRVLLATRNPKKLGELSRVLRDVVSGVEVVGLEAVMPYDEPPETEPTFAGNALIKARAGVQATDLPTVADDSGLCVDALAGMPGVLSARWSGRPKDDSANNELLLAQLSDIPDERRGAEFRCAVALAMPDGREELTSGVMRGRLVREPRGSGGFGYDAIFVPDDQPEEEALTSAELSAAEKDTISHRGKALRDMALVLADVLGVGPTTSRLASG
ncbi:MAG: RdgB/HAM1 family non-canonical purine NTP pyrophosphatase [Nocardioidaceae bacterium]